MMPLVLAALLLQGPVYQGLDYPVVPPSGYVEMPAQMFMLAGWAFDCQTGQTPPAVMVVAQRLTLGSPQVFVPQSLTLYRPLSRPDVAQAYRAICPSVSEATGYAIRVNPALPPGYWLVWVSWASAPGVQSSVARVVEIQ